MAQLGDAFMTPNQRVKQGHDAAQWQMNPDLLLGLISKAERTPVPWSMIPEYPVNAPPPNWYPWLKTPVRMG
jgi:hypothetical protein